jgi:hypothetical protein
MLVQNWYTRRYKISTESLTDRQLELLKLVVEHYRATGQPYIYNPANTRYDLMDMRALARANLIDLREGSGVLFCQPTQWGLTFVDQGVPQVEWMPYEEAIRQFKRGRRTLQEHVSRGKIPSKTEVRNGRKITLLFVERLRYYFS